MHEINYFYPFQLVTTNEKLEMQIRNLNKSQSNSQCVRRGDTSSLDSKEDNHNDVKNIKDTPVSGKSGKNYNYKAAYWYQNYIAM